MYDETVLSLGSGASCWWLLAALRFHWEASQVLM